MTELIEKIYNEAHSAWRFRWRGLGVAAVVALVGWAIVFVVPDRYEAKASIFVNTRTALQPVLQGLTVEQDVNAQLNYVQQSILTGSRLEKIARESGVLAPDVNDPRKVAAILKDLSERVTLSVEAAGAGSDWESAGSVYGITYEDVDRDRSLRVVDIVMRMLMEETLGGKRKGSEEAQKFLEEQIHAYEERLREGEKRLADFKKANIGLMPTQQGGYFDQLQAEIDGANLVENNLKVMMARREELARQLRGESVISAAVPASAPGQLAAGSDTLTRINEAQARLDDLLLRFTDRHPDVIAARATIAELQARRRAELESLRRGDAAAVASTGVGANPVYQNIQLQLNQADVEISSLRRQLEQHRARAADLRKRLDAATQVEAEFAALNRDYDINKAKYEALLENYEKSRLGEEADNAGSVRFENVQPPSAPFTPSSPNRPLLLSGVLVLALALGGGLAYFQHKVNPVVASISGLSTLTDVPILGVVSGAFPQYQRERARREILGFLGATCGIFVAFVLVLILSASGFRIGAAAGIS